MSLMRTFLAVSLIGFVGVSAAEATWREFWEYDSTVSDPDSTSWTSWAVSRLYLGKWDDTYIYTGLSGSQDDIRVIVNHAPIYWGSSDDRIVAAVTSSTPDSHVDFGIYKSSESALESNIRLKEGEEFQYTFEVTVDEGGSIDWPDTGSEFTIIHQLWQSTNAGNPAMSSHDIWRTSIRANQWSLLLA